MLYFTSSPKHSLALVFLAACFRSEWNEVGDPWCRVPSRITPTFKTFVKFVVRSGKYAISD